MDRGRAAVGLGGRGGGHKKNEPAIHQIFYLESQAEELDPDFIPLCNTGNPRPEWCEYHVFRTRYHAGECDQGITGFVSWKFRQKTGLAGAVFREWIIRNPGYDVYFVNPFPHLAHKRRPNVWYQGERSHPDLTKLTEALFRKIGRPLNLQGISMQERDVAYCNYWAGSPEFWRRYMAFCEPLYELVEYGITNEEKSRVLRRADAVSNCCYLPYIFERLFSTLLCVDRSIRPLGMSIAAEPRLTLMRRIQREAFRPYKRLVARVRGGK